MSTRNRRPLLPPSPASAKTSHGEEQQRRSAFGRAPQRGEPARQRPADRLKLPGNLARRLRRHREAGVLSPTACAAAADDPREHPARTCRRPLSRAKAGVYAVAAGARAGRPNQERGRPEGRACFCLSASGAMARGRGSPFGQCWVKNQAPGSLPSGSRIRRSIASMRRSRSISPFAWRSLSCSSMREARQRSSRSL
jgi:hypothetical protein